MGTCIKGQCVIKNEGESGNMQPTIDRRDDTILLRQSSDGKRDSRISIQEWREMDVCALTAMVDRTLLEIIVLGGAGRKCVERDGPSAIGKNVRAIQRKQR